jgi:nuclear receptor interaction protein
MPPDVQHRDAAKKRWAFRVGRGVLLNAAKDMKFKMVDRAFGGRGIADKKIRAEEQALKEMQADIDPLEDEGPVVDAELARSAWDQGSSTRAQAAASSSASADVIQPQSPNAEEVEQSDSESDEDEDSDGDVQSSEEGEDDSDDSGSDEEGLRRTRSGRMLWRTDFGRSRFKRDKVELDVPCAPHTRVYTGHCNVKTVKDVNYFGLQDEYVVSGSDSGHVFVWDRKTSQLVNILEGDGEVVNVVQGTCSFPTFTAVLMNVRPPVRAHDGSFRHRSYHQDLLA